jgi:hypothetical protein
MWRPMLAKIRNALFCGASYLHCYEERHVIEPDATLHLGIITAPRKAIP